MPAAAVFWFVVILVALLLTFAAFVLLWMRLNRGLVKGWTGELRAGRLHLRRLDSRSYTTFHDMYLPRPGSTDTTQIDHIVVSRFGIFVIETKNLSGWIFGSEHQKQWTVTYPSGEKHRFQNPLRQNHLHALAVVDFCNLQPGQVHSLVFLAGDGQPKTKAKMGKNVIYRHGLTERIQEHSAVLIDETTIRRCVSQLDAVCRQTGKSVRTAHLASLRERHR